MMFKFPIIRHNNCTYNKHNKIELSTKLNFICDTLDQSLFFLPFHHGCELELTLVVMCTKCKLPKCFSLVEFEARENFTTANKCFVICCTTC